MQETTTSEKRRESAPMSNREEVEAFLEAFASALTKGEGNVIAGMWEAPALVLSDAGAQAVSSAEEVASFFSGAKDQYLARGVVDTKPEILRLEWVTDRIAVVEVRWPWLDDKGCEVGYETSTYTLRRDASDALRLRVTVMHGASSQA